jgi:putative heme-binding domain-containing protein
VGLAAEDRLPNDLKFTARAELSTVRWPEIKAAAARALPAPQAAGNEAIPPVAELVKRKGDPARGAELFRNKATCATCHKAGGVGVDFGPDLSQVGTKLGKDALYESILDPSAGISFGFEAWLITLKSGDELFGLIASETETDVILKAQGGVLTTVKKSDIAQRAKQALSIMPAGLQALLSTQELVDLVEYLSTLRRDLP